MFLIIHGPVGALIGRYAHDPITAFFLGIVSHFLLDIIPHGDDNLSDKVGNGYWNRIAVGAIDGILTLAILFLFYHNSHYELSVITGSIGGLLPDFIWGVPEVMKRKAFDWYLKFHSANHMIIKKRLSFWKGMALQVVMVLALLLVIK